MKTLILSSFCALALNVSAAGAQQDTLYRYIIDNQKVENFDGSQLQGKTIKSYTVTEAKNESRNVVYQVHSIETVKSLFSYEKNENRIELKNPKEKIAEPLYVVDGEVADTVNRSSLSPERISSMVFYKPGSKEAAFYGDKGKNGVLKIVTVKSTEDATVYVIDGKKVEKGSLDGIAPDQIKSITVLKNPEEVKKYTDEKKSGVILIETKREK